MKSVLITGTNRGIGLGLVKTLVSGKTVPECIIATCRRPDEATELKEVASKNQNVHILQLDVNNFESYPKFSESVQKVVGNLGLNVLINNAGTAGKFLKIGYLKPNAMMESFKTNTVAPVMLTKEFLPLLKKAAEESKSESLGSSKAAVVNISSILGSINNNNTGGYYPYRCSKVALNSATRSLSVDLKEHKIMAVCIHPGWIKTEMGGKNAPMEVLPACETLIKTITSLTKAQNGMFLNYDGEPLPW